MGQDFAASRSTLPCRDPGEEQRAEPNRRRGNALLRFAVLDARNIVSALRANVELLAGLAMGARPTPITADALEDLAAGVEMLDELLSDALVEQGNRRPLVQTTTIGAAALLDRVASNVGPAATRRRVNLEVDHGHELDLVRVHASVLVRSLSTLVAELVRATPRGASVRLSSRVEEGSAVLRIEGPTFDDGPYTVPRRRSPQKSAIDVTACTAAARAHGGSVDVLQSGLTTHLAMRLPLAP